MGHAVSGVVSKWAETVHAAPVPWVVAPLAQGFGLAVQPDGHVPPGMPLPDDINRLIARLSGANGVAFVATDYFGGHGEQAAAAWGPSVAQHYEVAAGSINAALRSIGVERGDALDEFEAVGLGWFRSNEDWIEFAGNGKLSWQREPWPAAFAAWRACRGAQ